jgi:uridine kinase
MVADAAHPTLVVVSGPPGAGKTTLAHKIALLVSAIALAPRDRSRPGGGPAYHG